MPGAISCSTTGVEPIEGLMDDLRRLMKMSAAPVVAEPCPLGRHLIISGLGGLDVGKRGDESLEIGDHCCDLGLLEHDRDQTR